MSDQKNDKYCVTGFLLAIIFTAAIKITLLICIWAFLDKANVPQGCFYIAIHSACNATMLS